MIEAQKKLAGATRSARYIVGALAVVVAGFVASTLYTYESSVDIRERVGSITVNATASIVHLTTARSSLLRLESLLALHLDGLGPTAGDVEAARAQYRREIDAYLALPTYPGERRLWDDRRVPNGNIQRAMSRALALSDAGDAAGAREVLARTVSPDVEAVAASIESALALNAAALRGAAQDIERIRVRAGWVMLVLDVGCALLAVVVGAAAYRAIRASMKTAEDRRLALEQTNQELELFAGRVAHDILGPLTPATMALELAKRRVPHDERMSGTFDAALRGLARVRTMVDGLLEFARAGAAPNPSTRSRVEGVVSGVLEDARPLAADTRVELRAEVARVPVARCSTAVLTSIVSNLVRNAIKHIGEVPVREVCVRASAVDGRVRVEVTDTGPGIPAELGARIFEAYVRPRGSTTAGIGLGLATVKRLAETHGGAVGFEPLAERGTRFWVELPAASAVEPSPGSARG